MIKLPELCKINFDQFSTDRCAFIFAMGFEDRALSIPKLITECSTVNTVISIKYAAGTAKGQNKEAEAKSLFANSLKKIIELKYSSKIAHDFEYKVKKLCNTALKDIPEVVIDVSAMSKFLILVLIVCMLKAGKRIKIVFSSAAEYAPSLDEYKKVISSVGEERITSFAWQPSSGISAILRSVCLSSSRMQGQPVCAVAFTSFNEELIRHSVGTLNPHRLILINGIPPNPDFFWRAEATQNIHQKLINEYAEENPIDINTGLLQRSVSTLNYQETFNQLLKIRESYSTYERIIYFATGSKMQAVALALLKSTFSDVHIEYPTPDSYYFKEYSKGVGDMWSFDIDNSIIESIKNHQR